MCYCAAMSDRSSFADVWPAATVVRKVAPAALLALVLLLGVFFRFYRLDEKLLWHDEVATRVFAAGYTPEDWRDELRTGRVFDVAELQHYQRATPERGLSHPIAGIAADDPHHPPLYYILAGLWVACFGDGIGTLRALSVLFSLGTLPAMYWLGLELFRSRRTALAVMALSAVSPFFVLYAQEAREYSLWTLLIVLSYAALCSAIRQTKEKARGLLLVWAPYSFLTVVALYTSFSSAWVILSQIVYVLALERRISRVLLSCTAALAASACAVVPWAINLIRHFEVFEASMRWSKAIVIPRISLLRILGFNVTGTVVDIWPYEHEPGTYGVVAVTLGIVVWALVSVARAAPSQTKALVLPLVFVPIVVLLIPDLVFGGIRSISAKYLTPSWIGVQLALGWALANQSHRRAARMGEVIAALVVTVGVGSCWLNSLKVSVWTKGVSFLLPEVAQEVNASARPLLVANLEQYNPGNLMALSVRLAPGTKVQLLDAEKEERFVLPPEGDYTDVFLLSPIGVYREALEKRENVRCRLVRKDIFLELWKVERAGGRH